MKNKKVILYSVILLLAVFIIATLAFKENTKSNTQTIKEHKNSPFVRDYSPKFGKDNSKVTIVEFLDPECGACGAFYGAVKKVFSDHEADTQLVIRYLANHKNSEYVIKILESARKQNKFKEVLDIMFYYHETWAEHNNSKPMLIWDFLPQVTGLNIQKLKEDVKSIDVSSMLATDKSDSLLLKVTGTPEFFVNGKKLKKLSYQALDDLVVSEIYK